MDAEPEELFLVFFRRERFNVHIGGAETGPGIDVVPNSSSEEHIVGQQRKTDIHHQKGTSRSGENISTVKSGVQPQHASLAARVIAKVAKVN